MIQTPYRLELTPGAEPELRAAAVQRMVADNEAKADQPAEPSFVTVLVRDVAGASVGGLWGEVRWRWLTIGTLLVPEELRGQGVGRRLVLEAEAEARARGCVGSLTDTYSFQARGFYERLGYTVFGHLDGYPPGHGRYFLSKRL